MTAEDFVALLCVVVGALALLRARWIAARFCVRGSSRDEPGAWVLAWMNLIDDAPSRRYRLFMAVGAGIVLVVAGSVHLA